MALGACGPSALLGAVQAPGRACVEHARSKAAEDLRGALLRMVASAKECGPMRRVRAEQELGLSVVTSAFGGVGARIRCKEAPIMARSQRQSSLGATLVSWALVFLSLVLWKSRRWAG